MHPFLVLSLPRTRSAWTSVLLDCGHDELAYEESPEHLIHKHWLDKTGSCETFLAAFWDRIESRLSDFRVAVLVRDPEECLYSLMEAVPDLDEERTESMIDRVHEGLVKAQSHKGASSFLFDEMDHEDAIRDLWAQVRPDDEFPVERYARLARMRVNVDFGKLLTPEVIDNAQRMWAA